MDYEAKTEKIFYAIRETSKGNQSQGKFSINSAVSAAVMSTGIR